MRIALALVVAGCVVHVPLSVPSPAASVQDRERSYATIAPTALQATGFGSQLILRDGSTVVDPDDLLPVVPADSVTARAVQRAHAAHAEAVQLALGGLTIELAGAVWLGAGIAHDIAVGNMTGGPAPFTRQDGFALATMGVGMIVGLASLFYIQRELRERAAAFATYDASLRAQLRLCTNGYAVVACP